MKGHWRNLLNKTAIWLVAEILLTLVGLDNLADYSEFIFGQELATKSYDRPIETALFDQKSSPFDGSHLYLT